MKKEMSVDDALDEVLASHQFDEIPSVSRTLANEVVRLRRENADLRKLLLITSLQVRNNE